MRHEVIKIKGEEPQPFDIMSSHRGPIVTSELLLGADVLFADGMHDDKLHNTYSFAWSGDVPYERTIKLVRQMYKSQSP